jgi:hypothetical protein
MTWARSQLNAAMLPSARLRRVLTAIGPALVLVAIAVWEIVASARAGRSVPGPDGWARAEAVVRQGYRPGDLIVFAPAWIDPVGREHLGDLIPIEAAARMDADRFAVIWEVSIRGARAPETRGLTPASVTGGEVTVRRFEREPVEVVADLLATPSTPPAHVVIGEVGFAPHRCIEVIPRPGGTTRLDFGQVTLGSSLVGYAGRADVFARQKFRDPAHFELQVDGATVADVGLGIDDGWRRFAADTTPGPHHVEVLASAVGKNAHVCFAAEARR